MARLKNVKSGAIVSVADEKAARLGSDWVAADAPEVEPKRAPGRPKKSDA